MFLWTVVVGICFRIDIVVELVFGVGDFLFDLFVFCTIALDCFVMLRFVLFGCRLDPHSIYVEFIDCMRIFNQKASVCLIVFIYFTRIVFLTHSFTGHLFV